MKRIFTFFAAVLLMVSVFAQSPGKISYQAVVRNSQGELVVKQNVGVRISILQSSANGTEVYSEVINPLPETNTNGLLSISFGGETGFDAIDWSNGIYFIQTEIDPTGGVNYTITGVSQLLSVPYALHSKTADSISGDIYEYDPVFMSWDKSYNDLANKPNLLDSIIAVLDTSSQFLRTEIDGSITNEIQNLSGVLTEGNDAGNQTIVNVAQQGIGTASPNTSAALEISSTGKGVLIPRMNMTDIQSIQNPEQGLIVMDTTSGKYNIMVFDGLEWLKIINNSSSYQNLVLWNKLGSVDEVENSKYGENGMIVGDSYSFEPAYDGNGYVRKSTGSNYINFPGSVLQNLKEKGTVELWINPKVTNPVAFSYGVFALVGNVFGNSSHIYIAWGDGTSGTGLYGTVNFDGTGHQTPFEPTQFVAEIGTPFHVALCWDVNGIDGSLNTVRLYRDGELVSAIDDTWDSDNTTTNYEGFNLGISPDGNGYDKFIVDELKVWGYARTRFESPTGTFIAGDLEVEGSIKGSIHIDTVHVSQIAGLLGQNYTLNFPQIIDNMTTLEIEGILSMEVVIISSIGAETERISTPLGIHGQTGEQTYSESPGLTMEYPFIFEPINDTDRDLVAEWFDNPSGANRNASVILRYLNGNEYSRWTLLNCNTDGYEQGADGRTRFTMKQVDPASNSLEFNYDGVIPGELSFNASTDKRVEIEGVNTGNYFCPAVFIDTSERTVILELDYNEGGAIYDWVINTIVGNDHLRAMSIIETTNGLDELSRMNYFNCIPIKHEFYYGFGQNTKLKLRIVVAYGFREEA